MTVLQIVLNIIYIDLEKLVNYPSALTLARKGFTKPQL